MKGFLGFEPRVAESKAHDGGRHFRKAAVPKEKPVLE